MELIFSTLGEKVTTEITKNEGSQGFTKCQNDAKRGGRVAGNARLETEKEIGKKITSKKNYLNQHQNKKLIE